MRLIVKELVVKWKVDNAYGRRGRKNIYWELTKYGSLLVNRIRAIEALEKI